MAQDLPWLCGVWWRRFPCALVSHVQDLQHPHFRDLARNCDQTFRVIKVSLLARGGSKENPNRWENIQFAACGVQTCCPIQDENLRTHQHYCLWMLPRQPGLFEHETSPSPMPDGLSKCKSGACAPEYANTSRRCSWNLFVISQSNTWTKNGYVYIIVLYIIYRHIHTITCLKNIYVCTYSLLSVCLERGV